MGFWVVAFLVMISLGVAAGILYAVTKVLWFVYNVGQPTFTQLAVIVGKRTVSEVDEDNRVWTQHLCLFEFKGGGRAEYDVGGREYTAAVVGDTMEVDTRGVLFWGCRRVAK